MEANRLEVKEVKRKEPECTAIRSSSYKNKPLKDYHIILTGVNQVTSKINSDNMQKLDTEFVETSWHSTARPTHQVWQGRVFYWDRANPNAEKIEAGVLYKSFIRETGYGEVDGLCGANCRHTFYPFIPGISVRTR